MVPSEVMRIAGKVARRYARSAQEAEEFAAEAALRIVEALQREAESETRVAYVSARNHILDLLRRKRTTPDAMSIHWCVTETIEEWKRAPDQEDVACFSELRRIAAQALTPPQFSILLRRTADQELADVAHELDMNIKTVSRYHLNGVAALAAAVLDDDD